MTLRLGDKGAAVRALQMRLVSRGLDVGSGSGGLGIDGDYGPKTVNAVSAWQRRVGLKQTGEADPATMDSLVRQPGDLPWMVAFRGDLGLEEVPGAGNNPRVVEYYGLAGFPGVTTDSTAWCKAALDAWLIRGGVPRTWTPSLMARDALKIGTPVPLADAREGDIAVFARDSAAPSNGHTGLVLGWRGGKIVIGGGNQSNAVTVELRAASVEGPNRVLGIRRVTAGGSMTDLPFLPPPDAAAGGEGADAGPKTPAQPTSVSTGKPGGLWGLILAILKALGLAK